MRILLAICVLFPMAAFGQAMDMDMPGMGSGADKAMAAGMAKMNAGMEHAPMTGDADRDFVAMMLPHHQGAVDMAETELKYGHDPELRRMATQIIAAQDKEIAEMQAWQQAHPGQ